MNLTDGNKKLNYLVETALLGHGLQSVDDDLIMSLWTDDAMLAWVEKGEIRIGSITEFIPSRKQSDNWERLDGKAIINGEYKDKNAFLTASATMAVAREIQCPVVVTAGIGGIGDIKSEPLSYDLPALAEMKTILVATSPKDMLDITKTLVWLHENGVNTYGYNTEVCNGYIFVLEPRELDKKITEIDLKNISRGCTLILNPIPEDKRLENLELLQMGISAGKNAENIGSYYHPAANSYFDKSSNGLSSVIQLEALMSNINIAKKIIL